MSGDQDLADQIKLGVQAFWRMRQHGPRVVRVHSNDMTRIRHDEEYDGKVVPPTMRDARSR